MSVIRFTGPSHPPSVLDDTSRTLAHCWLDAIKRMKLKKKVKRSVKAARQAAHQRRQRIFLRLKAPLFSTTDFLLKMGWSRMAALLFRFYNLLENRFTSHSILAARAIDLCNTEADVPQISLADAILTRSQGPKEIGSGHYNQAQVLAPPVFAALFSNVIIHPNASAIFDPNKQCLFLQRIQHPDEDQFCYHHKYLAALKGNYGILRFPKNIEKITRGIFLAGTGSFNYYHYLLEFISKTEYLHQLGKAYQKYPLLVHPNAERIDNFHELLKLANHQSRQVIFLSEERAYHVENLIQISHLSLGPFNLRGDLKFKVSYFYTRPSTVTYLRNLVLPKALKQNQRSKRLARIFLSRKPGGRRTYNQEDVVGIAQKYGFKEIYIEDYNIYQQARLFHQAEVIVGPGGAAWTNLIFARQDARGLYFLTDRIGDLSVFSNLAHIVGFDLVHIIAPTENEHLHSSYHLDPTIFETALTDCLNS